MRTLRAFLFNRCVRTDNFFQATIDALICFEIKYSFIKLSKPNTNNKICVGKSVSDL